MEDSRCIDMETDDLTTLPYSGSPAGRGEKGLQKTNCIESQPSNSEVEVVNPNGDTLQSKEVDNDNEAVGDGSSLSIHKRGRNCATDAVSGAKRPRITDDEHQPTVHVIYNSLTRESKQKLEELLNKWSEWHAQHHSSSHDSKIGLECGEGTYFPALHVGLDIPSAVPFWMDNQSRNPNSKEFIPLDADSVPIYDRGYSFGLTSADGSGSADGCLEIVDGSRCFNCGSYNHSLKECPKPRDNAAVNNARNQHKSRRNQNGSSRNPTRYYQNTPGGKYDGIRPGVLQEETRKLLGLGELDPPPWLNRMREIGYPPGYLDPDDDEEQPSGIMIFDDEEIRLETEDGEILDHTEPPIPERKKKMSIEFPGLNAPVPEKADERRWATTPSAVGSRNRLHHRFNHSTETTIKSDSPEPRWTSKYRDDGPPGVEPGRVPVISGFSPRYIDHDAIYNSRSPKGGFLTPRSPNYGMSLSDRGRTSPLIYGSPSSHDRYSFESRDDDRRYGHMPDSFSSRRGRQIEQFRRSYR